MIARGTFLLALLPALAGAAEPSYTVGEFAYKVLSKVDELMGEEKYREAQEQLERLERRKGLTDYERALVWQRCGYLETYRDRLGPAAACFEKSVGTGALPEATQRDLLFNLGQLYLQLERYPEAVDALERWRPLAATVTPDAKYMLAIAYFKVNKLAEAEQWAVAAVDAIREPKESWLQMLLAVRVERKRFAAAVEVAQALIYRRPENRAYWVQLTGLYDELDRTTDALATRELMHEQGLLTNESDFVDLAQRYAYHGVPLRAAEVLAQGMESGRIPDTSKNLLRLGEAWLRAAEYERAVPPLDRAASLSDDGDLHLRLSRVHLSAGKWDRAVASARRALSKGGLKSEGRAHLAIGQAHFSAQRYDEAKAAFETAARFADTKREAEQWIRSLPAV